MENTITDLLDAVIPKLSDLLSSMRFWMAFVMCIGPLLFIGLGLFYRKWAPPEANHKLGYRTYFGMGSVAAWKYTQKLAGIVWLSVGIALAVVAIVGCVLTFTMEQDKGTNAALIILIAEFVVALAAYITVEVMVMAHFDINGKKRKK